MEEEEKSEKMKSLLDNNKNDKESTDITTDPPDNRRDLVSELLGTDDSISEHLTSSSGSVENDRSLQEIEIFNQPDHTMPSSDENISKEMKPSSFSNFESDQSDSSTLAEKVPDQKHNEGHLSGQLNAKSIMEEILTNEQFHSSHDASDTSKEESFNIFAGVNLDDTSLIGLSKMRKNCRKSRGNSLKSKENSLNSLNEAFLTKENSLNEKNIFETDFDLPHDSNKQLGHLEEILDAKEEVIRALRSEIDSLRENSNTFNSSFLSTTEYRQLQEDCANKLAENDSAIIFKNNMIQELSESLKQSVEERNELLKQIELYRSEILDLQDKVKETSRMFQEHKCAIKPLNGNGQENAEPLINISHRFEENKYESKSLNKVLLEDDLREHDKNSFVSDRKSAEDEKLLEIIEKNLNKHTQCDSEKIPYDDYVVNLENELKDLKVKLNSDREEYDTEIHRLRELISNLKCGSSELMELKTELEVTHQKEMEELRKYFEQKCTELEKNYSEEIYSQHSRKLSESSSGTEPSMDLLVSNQPGPGGDTNRVLKTKEDLEKLQENIKKLDNKLSQYDVTNEQELSLIETEIRNDLNSLLKIGEKLEFKEMQNNYMEEISNMRHQLEQCRKNHIAMSSAIQEVVSSGEFELEDIVQSYERRLQEQVNLARIDIISDLDMQFQKLLADDCTKDEVWPEEFLKIKENFSRKYEKQIEILKEEHQDELARLKDEHLRVLNSALERAKRRNSRDGDSVNESEIGFIVKERNYFKGQVYSLRSLISELVSYFVQCEDTLNNTLIEELLKLGTEDDIANLDDSAGTGSLSNVSAVTRVHITPNFDGLISKIEDRSQLDDSQDISDELKNELGICLKKLTQDANTVLAMTANLRTQNSALNQTTPPDSPGKRQIPPEKEKISLDKMTHEMDLKLKYKQELEDANIMLETLEKEKTTMEHRLDDALEKIRTLELELQESKFRIAELLEQKELVSEGYGEQGGPILIGLEDTMAMLASLQEKARALLAQSRTSADPNILQLIEELCKVSEKIREDAMRERNDLVQQIEAADKKYKTTQKFLEEQAQEREMERDEAQKRIMDLQERLKDRDKDRRNSQIMSSEAQHLESQLEEAAFVLQAELKKYKELELERDEAVEKITYLRDIIIELENQNDMKNKEIEEQIKTVDKLQCIIQEQHKVIDDLKNLDSFKSLSDNRELRHHIELLEEELQKLRISAELAGSEGATKQIKIQLYDLEICLEKKTKDLEQLFQATGTNSCSSPSEEMSVRDLVRPQSPNSTMEDCEVPLQQLARIKEKLIRHNRAEESALKRMRDLEMQVQHLKAELEEAYNEKDEMKKQNNEHIVLISDLQIRLDQQRIRAEYIEKQTNDSLESKIFQLISEIQNLQEKLNTKEKLLTQSEHLLAETRKQLEDFQKEFNCPKSDEEILINLQKELDNLRCDNEKLNHKLAGDAQLLVDKIIKDKNMDIEKLRNELEHTQNQLQNYTALNLDRHDLKTLANLKNSGTCLEQILSVIDLSQPIEKMRRYDSHSGNFDCFGVSDKMGQKQNETEFLGSSTEISNIEKVGPSNLHYTVAAPLGKPNSTEILKSAEKKVHFEDMAIETQNLLKQLEEKDKIILDLEYRLSLLNDLEAKLKKLQYQLDNAEKALASANETFKAEQESAREKERQLGVELAEKKLHLSEREKEIEQLKLDSNRKDDMCLKLAREKKDLEVNLREFKKDSLNNLDLVISEKNAQNLDLQKQLSSTVDQFVALKQELNNKKIEVKSTFEHYVILKQDYEKLKDNYQALESQNKDISENLAFKIKKVKYEHQQNVIAHREIKSLKIQINALETKIECLNETVKLQEAQINEKNHELEIFTEEMKRLENKLSEADSKFKDLQNSNNAIDKDEKDKLNKEIENLKGDIDEKDQAVAKIQEDYELVIHEKSKEIEHLRDYMGEKDKVIEKMKEDYEVVKRNLYSIHNKIKETGNILDLSNRLKTEQKKNAELLEEIHNLKAKLHNFELANSTPVEEITHQPQKELNYSAQIDANISSAVSDQSLSSISEGQDLEVYKKALARQKSLNRKLVRAKEELEKQNLALEQAKQNFLEEINNLQAKLDSEKINFRQIQIKDGQLIEQMRIQLEALLEEREKFERLVNDEKNCRRALEVQLEELKKSLSSTESSTKYKSLPNPDTLELMQLKTELEKMNEEKLTNAKKLHEINQIKNQLENNLKYTKEMLLLEAERNRNAEEKIRMFIEKEKALNLEILQKKFEVDNRMTEIEEKKILIDELQQEKSLLKKQKNDLINALKAPPISQSYTNELHLSENSQRLIQELKIKTAENKKQLEYVEKLENEIRKLEAQIRSESRNKTDNEVEFRHLVARCDYLLAKTLKLDSIRKALIWQKRYLGDFLQSHRRKCLVDALPENQPHDRTCIKRRHSPLAHFRSAVYVVISIARMQFLVKRWHHGIRKVEKINSRHYVKKGPQSNKETSPNGANFHVGHPVSNDNFSPVTLRLTSPPTSTNPFLSYHSQQNHPSRPVSPSISTISLGSTVRDPSVSLSNHHRDCRENSWSGHTPPCKETRRRDQLIRIGTNSLSKNDVTPLKAPQLLAQFQERFQQIQEKLTFPLDVDSS